MLYRLRQLHNQFLGSRVRLAFEKVLRFGAVAPRMRFNSGSCSFAASHISLRLPALVICPWSSARTWLKAENERMSAFASFAKLSASPGGIHWTS